MKKNLRFTLLSFLLFLGFTSVSWGQATISVGTPYTQNFDGIGNTNNATLPSGWRMENVNSERTLNNAFTSFLTNTNLVLAFNAALSSSAANGRYNFGGTTASDRSIGGLSSGSASKTVSMALALDNNGEEPISSFSISYDVERYRNGSNPAGFSIRFYYSLTGLANSWIEIPELITSFSANGNNNGATSNPLESISVTDFLINQSLPVSNTIYFAWSYSVTSGSTTTSSQAIGIDNILITANPVSGSSPSLNTSTSSLDSYGEVTVGTSSISQNFTVTGNNLVENVVVNAPANFEISLDNVSFTNQLTLVPTDGEVNSTIYARFSPVATGLRNGNITLVSGSLNRSVAVTGTGIFTISLTTNGYQEDFSGFNSFATLPLGWAVSNTTYAGDWGSGTGIGLRGNDNVLGFQHTGASGTFTTSSTYTNNTGSVITDLLVSYLGKVARIDQTRNPIWTVTVAGNVVAALSYDTAVNQDQLVSSVVSGLNIPVGANFTIEFSSQRGGTTGTSKQIGIGDFNIQSVTVWNGLAWSNGEPTSTKNAVIQGDYTTTANLEANTLTVNSGVFTIASGTSVTVEGAVVNNAAATNFIVENNGNLLQNATATNVGAITVRANSQALMRLDYTLWSSPVAGQNLKAFSPNTLSPRFYVYDETATTGNSSSNNGTYVTVLNETNEATYNFEAAQGYLIRTPNNHPTTPTVYNGVFTGVPHNGDFSATLSNVNAGYNLVGNPYPSSIDLNAFFTGNSAIENTVWFWRKTNGAAGDGYVTANNLGYTFPGQSADGATNIGIRSGQGFFVKATGAGSVSFTNGMRATNTTSTFFRNATASETPSRIWLQVANSTEVLASALVGYTSAATLGVDAGFDSKPFGTSSLVSLIETEGYAIQGRSSFEVTDQVALGFEAETAGNYSISIANKDGVFASGQAIYLQDLAQNITHDFANGAYQFVSEVGTFNNRFRMVYENETLGIDDVVANQAYVYNNNGVLTVANTKEEIKSVVIFDIQGRVLTSASDVNANQWQAPAMVQKNQVLLVQVTTAAGVSTTKTVF